MGPLPIKINPYTFDMKGSSATLKPAWGKSNLSCAAAIVAIKIRKIK